MALYRDRHDAGEKLADALEDPRSTGALERAVRELNERGRSYRGVRPPAQVDRVVCAATPEPFHAVGLWYEDFSPTTDDEVRHILASAGSSREVGAEGAP
jgi:predicted phosphoribosyltransferase